MNERWKKLSTKVEKTNRCLIVSLRWELKRFDGPCMQTATVAAGHARPCALASVCRRHHVKEQWKKLSIKVKKAVFDCFATAIKFIGS